MKKLFVLALIGSAVWFFTQNGGGDAAETGPDTDAPAGASSASDGDDAAPGTPAAESPQIRETLNAGNTAWQQLGTAADPTEREPLLVVARDAYARLLLGELPLEMRRELINRVDALNAELVFSSMPTRYSDMYTVEPGDNLLDLGTKFGQGVGLLMKMNGLSDAAHLRVGQTLKVLTGRTHVVVDKSQFTLSFFCGDQLVKQYLIGTGVNNCTPEGVFDIATKMRNPEWRGVANDDPRNPLGTRWMGFRGEWRQYGIHGTREPEKIPGECSRGCIRMRNADVEELMEFVTYRAQVEIRP